MTQEQKILLLQMRLATGMNLGILNELRSSSSSSPTPIATGTVSVGNYQRPRGNAVTERPTSWLAVARLVKGDYDTAAEFFRSIATDAQRMEIDLALLKLASGMSVGQGRLAMGLTITEEKRKEILQLLKADGSTAALGFEKMFKDNADNEKKGGEQ